jgi:hypothetical protein
MNRVSRAPKDRSKAEPDRSPAAAARAPIQPKAAPAPGWSTGYAGAPFALGGVQRKVAIGQANDPYEQEAERVAQTIASGGSITPESISQIGSGGPPVGQRAAAPAPKTAATPEAGKRKDDTGKMPPVQKAAAPATTNKKEEGKKPVQKAAKPGAAAAPTDDKKKEAKPPAAQRAEKERRGEERHKPIEDKLKDTPVQKAAAKPEEKKPVQKAAAPTGDKKQEVKPPAAQRAGKERKGEERQKPVEEKLKDVPVQKAALPKEKEPEPAAEPAMQLAAQPDSQKPEPKKEAPRATQKSAQPAKDRDKADAERAGPIQRDTDHHEHTPSPAMERSAERAIQSKGAGEPMHGPTRQALERGMGLDFNDVRVHDGGGAQAAARDLDARAFTQGRDIWLGGGESQHNVGLMAHEATHVAQQTGSVQRMLVQRAGPKASGPSADAAEEGNWDYDGSEGKIRKGHALVIPSLRVPDFKKDETKTPFELPKTERSDKQRDVWDREAKGAPIKGALDEKTKGGKGLVPAEGGSAYFLKLAAENNYLIGDYSTVEPKLLRPFWDKTGDRTFYHVDHKHEFQLGGADEDINNLWLLDAETNIASGLKIKEEKDKQIEKLLKAGQEKPKEPVWKGDPPSVPQVKDSYKITFLGVRGGLDVGKPKIWTIKQIRDEAEQIKPLNPLSTAEIDKKGLRGTEDTLIIYTNKAGGGVRKVSGWKTGKMKIDRPEVGKMFEIKGVTYDPATSTGTLTAGLYAKSPIVSPKTVTVEIARMPGIEYGGYISERSLLQELNKTFDVKSMSPVELEFIELTDRGIVGRGKVLPTIPLIKDLKLNLILDGDNIYISKVFSAGDFKFPGPIKVPAASLELYAGTQGIGARGDVFIEIERLGKGKITGRASTGEGFAISGDFEFDTKLFDPAKVHVEYSHNTFSGGGEIGIPAGKVKGIRSANIQASFQGESIAAKGSIKPSIPGVEQADMSMSYSPEQGVIIGGHLELKKDIPGIAAGSVDVTLTKPAGAENYKVKAVGSATPKLPGISAQLTVSYDDGLFDIVGTAGYDKGRLKGSVTVGATNRPVGADGAPAAGEVPPTNKIILYGGGSLTLRLAPWLEGMAAVKFKPSGEIEVTGRIGLPNALPITPAKGFDKNLFKVGIDIPIVGVSIAGQRIGIFANIAGGIDLSVGIDKGMLQDVHLDITYNPAHEEDTHVVGAAQLHIPAHAGIRMFVRGSLGIGIPIVSASAGLEVGGGIGLEGALDAAVNVDWTPAKGLDIQATAEIYVEPKLKFDVVGFVLVEADLWITTIELYSKRWQLASVEYGSGLRFGLRLPIHYQEDKPFDISWSDVEIIKPDLNAMDILTGLVKKIA